MSFEGTLADYMSMKPGDNIYFFCKRRYYGIGELISIGLIASIVIILVHLQGSMCSMKI